MEIQQKIDLLNWDGITADMNEKGYAHLSKILTSEACDQFISQYKNESLYRKTINMERYRFGLGEYKYYQYPLPNLIQQLRENIYPKLAPIANSWMNVLNIDQHFPESLDQLLELCHAKNQIRPTPLILQYGKGGYNTLHQDLYGDVYFPMQAVLFLNEPGEDYEGGEFVLIEQRPRAQSKAIVLKPGKGDMLLFTTSFRPVKGSKGYYRVNMKHGVSELAEGRRYTLGIIFHDAM
ncbi:MAG TPA: 2OG-Fe(II) oxygenase [Mucilaginibacter sp.]